MNKKDSNQVSISVYMDVGSMIANNISPRQALILREILMGETSYRTIRKKLGFRAMNMCMDVEIMRRDGFLTNKKDGPDRRLAHIRLTRKGKKLINDLI